ncbi:MAG TPA: type II toxin-antitoxin system VapC family toxin [Terracidiphilus sp.]|nr:type II toxin-antitoxin system VapC family toxin [Terracidiphilus sp.]
MEIAFWDSSMVVPLCVRQAITSNAQVLGEQFRMVVSWFARVEVHSSIARMLRMGQITANERVQGFVLLDRIRADWREVTPSEAMRQKAEDFVERFPLRAADALQLASAWIWCQGHPRGRPFIAGDVQLLDAARQLGFQTVEPL